MGKYIKPKITFTGGGTAGHVTPNLALIEKCLEEGWIVSYIGTNAIEKELVGKYKKVKFKTIICDKLRRYFSFKHAFAPFKICLGITQSFFYIYFLKPKVIFSKGGFVAFPVCLAGWLNKVPVIIHESDRSFGLTNKLCFPFAKIICFDFERDNLPEKIKHKAVFTGSPLRQIFNKYEKLTFPKPLLFVFGGSMGSELLNKMIRANLESLTEKYHIIHGCGKGNLDKALLGKDSYEQHEYIGDEFASILDAARIVIARGGANSIYEIAYLKKPSIIVPLSKNASRGDQIENANAYKERGVCEIIEEENLTSVNLKKTIGLIEKNYDQYLANLEKLNIKNGTEEIFKLLEETVNS